MVHGMGSGLGCLRRVLHEGQTARPLQEKGTRWQILIDIEHTAFFIDIQRTRIGFGKLKTVQPINRAIACRRRQ
jgi:hypothetical protein